MPRHQAMGHGDLFIEYSVVLPAQVTGKFRSGEFRAQVSAHHHHRGWGTEKKLGFD